MPSAYSWFGDQRTVKPRTPSDPTSLTLLVYTPDREILAPETGEAIDPGLIDWRTQPRSIIVGRHLPALVAEITGRYETDPDFQWRASELTNAIESSNAVIMRTVVSYFGFKHHSGGHWHRCLDLDMFYSNSSSTAEIQTVEQMIDFARSLTKFIDDEGLSFSPTASGLSGQFLRDSRFYPDARRKVPSFINEQARTQLPGNYYRLDCQIEKRYQALELDQKRSHHFHAEHERMPDSNSIMAHGDTRELKDISFGRTPSGFSGLIYARTTYDGDEIQDRFIWSSELPYLKDIGLKVIGVIASWGSTQRDKGIVRYARYCQNRLDKYSDAGWLKPILLTTYGLLGSRPRELTSIHFRAKGKPFDLVTDGEWLHGFLVSHSHGRKVDPKVANVLQRGIIEAATKTESLAFAKHLTLNGVTVLSIYADAVIVDDGNRDEIESLLLPPWRIKGNLTDWTPLSTQAYISVERERLPGITGTERRRLNRRSFAPVKSYTEAVTGREIRRKEQETRGLKIKHI